MRDPKITHHELVFARNCTYGEGVRIIGPSNVYDSEFADGVFIGPFTEVGGAKIGKNTKISSHSYICPGVEIGEECFVGHGVFTTNDLYSDVPTYETLAELGTKWKKRTTKIGNRVRIGSGAVILCGLTIGDGAIVGAGCVVTKNVPAGATVVGVPAREFAHPNNPKITDSEGRFLHGLGETKIS